MTRPPRRGTVARHEEVSAPALPHPCSRIDSAARAGRESVARRRERRARRRQRQNDRVFRPRLRRHLRPAVRRERAVAALRRAGHDRDDRLRDAGAARRSAAASSRSPARCGKPGSSAAPTRGTSRERPRRPRRPNATSVPPWTAVSRKSGRRRRDSSRLRWRTTPPRAAKRSAARRRRSSPSPRRTG